MLIKKSLLISLISTVYLFPASAMEAENDFGKKSFTLLPLLSLSGQEDCATLYHLGLKFHEGKNYAEAFEVLHRSANLGYPSAQSLLGSLYRDRQGIPKQELPNADFLAVDCYKKAASQGHIAGQRNLGFMYLDGNGVQQSYTKALEWFRKAADQGDVIAKELVEVSTNRGQLAEKMKNLDLQLSELDKQSEALSKETRWSADQGDPIAQFNLGLMYHTGTGETQSYSEAAAWYYKAANLGYAAAQFCLGECYTRGQGVPQSHEEAAKWYHQAAEQGHVNAQFLLGTLYAEGKGVTQSIPEAMKWFRMAADQGDADSRLLLDELEKFVM